MSFVVDVDVSVVFLSGGFSDLSAFSVEGFASFASDAFVSVESLFQLDA